MRKYTEQKTTQHQNITKGLGKLSSALKSKTSYPNKHLAMRLCLFMEKTLAESGRETQLQGKLEKLQSSSDLDTFCKKHESLACELIEHLSDKNHDIVCSKLSLVLYDLLREEGLL